MTLFFLNDTFYVLFRLKKLKSLMTHFLRTLKQIFLNTTKKDFKPSWSYLHSSSDEEGRDHDSPACQEVWVGVDEGGQAEVVHHEVVQPAVSCLVHRGGHCSTNRTNWN